MNLGTLLTPELLFAAGGLLFNIFALPPLLNKNAAIPRLQSIPSVFIYLIFFTAPYIYIGYTLSAISTTIGATLWTLIAIYRAPTPRSTSTTDTTATTATTQPAD